MVASKCFNFLIDIPLSCFEYLPKSKELTEHQWVVDIVLPILDSLLLELKRVHVNEMLPIKVASIQLINPSKSVLGCPSLGLPLIDFAQSLGNWFDILLVKYRLDND